MLACCPGSSSGKPYVQPVAVRNAVEASITRVRPLSINATASRAASSGRHRMTKSASLSAARRAPSSLRCASASVMSAMSARSASRSAISSPVVPAAPSMNTGNRHDALPRQFGRRQHCAIDIAHQRGGRRNSPRLARRHVEHFEEFTGVDFAERRPVGCEQRTIASHAHRQRRCVMRREYPVGEPDIGQVGPDGLGSGVDRRRRSGQRKATRWPGGGQSSAWRRGIGRTLQENAPLQPCARHRYCACRFHHVAGADSRGRQACSRRE